MPYFLSPFGNAQSFDAAGNPLVGGSWRTFLAGTSTPQTTFTSQTGATQQGTTMTLDAMGLPVNGPVWMLNGQALKFRLFNASGVVLDEWDNISGIGDVNTAPDEWVLFSATPTYLTATSFTVAGDQTNTFQINRKLKSTNSGGTVYSTIVSSVFSVTATTVTVINTSGVLDTGLSAVSYGLLAANNPSIPEGAFGATLRLTATQAAARVALNISDSVRQTVLSGPVDTNGQSAFGGATGSTVVTAAGTLVMTAANDILNRQGTKLNPSWTGLSTNGTMYLYADVSAAGTITEGVGALAPIYQWGGTPAITSGLFTYNIQENKGYIGTGVVATAGYRVYVGEVTVAAGVVTAIVWYALMRRFTGAFVATLPTNSVQVSANHNLGTQEFLGQFEAECTTADNGYAIGQRIDLLVAGITGTFAVPLAIAKNRNSMTLGTANAASGPFFTSPAAGGTAIGLVNTSWKYRFVAIGRF